MSAITSSQPDMVRTGTKTELMKTSGKTQIKPATWAVSTSLTTMPKNAETHENVIPKSTAKAMTATALAAPS